MKQRRVRDLMRFLVHDAVRARRVVATRMRVAGALMVLMTLTLNLLGSGISAPSARATGGGITITTDLNQQAGTIPEMGSSLLNFVPTFDWSTAFAGSVPANTVSSLYPFLKQVEMVDATGGCYTSYSGCTNISNRDLFVDPSNTSTMTDYDPSKLITATTNILNQGLTPYIVTGAVPIKMSMCPGSTPPISPVIGVFGWNISPPCDYTAYYYYIKAIADALVAQYGINTVKTWRWGVLQEYNNEDSFCAGGSPCDGASTEQAYFKLYDYTVAALQAAIGASNLIVGAHACVDQCNLAWDPGDFIDHVASGTNYYTGDTGTQIDFLTASYYELSPGHAIPPLSDFDMIATLRNRAVADGLTNLLYAIDEGRILNGSDAHVLASAAVGASHEGSFDALYFKQLLANNVQYGSRFGLNSNGLWGTYPNYTAITNSVDAASTNVAQLIHKMAGDTYVPVATTGSPADPNNTVDGVASYSSSSNTMHVLAFNHNLSMTSTTSETPIITINDIAPVNGSTVTVKTWVVDDIHAQYWPTWQADAAAQGITSSDYKVCRVVNNVDEPCSVDSDDPQQLLDPTSLAYFNSRLSTYQALAALSSTTSTITVTGSSITLTPTIANHGVVLYEITNAQPTGSTNLVTNGGFESGLTNWSTWAGSVTTTSDAHSGSSAALLGSGMASLGQQVTLTAGSTYTLLGCGKVSAPGQSGSIGAESIVDSQRIQFSIPFTSKSYTCGQVQFTVPSTATASYVFAYNPEGSGSLYADDIRVIPATNLMTNGGFESGLANWLTWAGSVTTTSDAHSGSSAALLGSVTAASSLGQQVSLIPGNTYTLSGCGKVSAADQGGSIGIESAIGSNILGKSWIPFTSIAYSCGEIQFTVPPTATTSYVFSYFGAGSGNLYVDDINLGPTYPS